MMEVFLLVSWFPIRTPPKPLGFGLALRPAAAPQPHRIPAQSEVLNPRSAFFGFAQQNRRPPYGGGEKRMSEP
jgi:hypothetical protein